MVPMRLFIAIDLPKAIEKRIGEMEAELGRWGFDVKYVEPWSLHLTLKFLGEVDDSLVPEIERKVEGIVRDIENFKAEIKGFGFFGSGNHVRVLWLGITEGKERLVEIIEKLNAELDYIRKDDYKPSPHLTIGRVRSGKDRHIILREIEKLKDVEIGWIGVKSIKLKKSQLSAKGPSYSDVKAFPLK
ncbi:MAG: RNA 2',3'-cyclic phosphodiesterase [Candidatus Aenigmarchaeota archaeon]|nr:RNA 2',3'-cyclic phosphodiesterase [Candidatus Aenigmarchaeota archaeon]